VGEAAKAGDHIPVPAVAQFSVSLDKLRELEAAMVRVQSEEIEQMTRWYQKWYSTSNR
jgi:uncharacterized protein (DUF305 family)